MIEILDYWLAGFRWYRHLRGGIWHHVLGTIMGGNVALWKQGEPPPFVKVDAAENWKHRVK